MDGRNTCGHDVIVVSPLAACPDRTYIWADTEPRPTMDRIGATEARRHLSRLIRCVAQGPSLTITRHGKPFARLMPTPHDRERVRQTTARIIERRRHIERVPLADLKVTIHEGHRY